MRRNEKQEDLKDVENATLGTAFHCERFNLDLFLHMLVSITIPRYFTHGPEPHKKDIMLDSFDSSRPSESDSCLLLHNYLP